MKALLTYFFLIALTTSVYSQVSDENMEVFRTKWRMELGEKAEVKAASVPKIYGKSAFGDSVTKQFYIDTFIVDNVCKKHQLKDPSTLGINKANMLALKDYEKLVDSYSALLVSKLADKDKELFQSSTNKWLAFIEDERTLCGRLMQPEYSGGGSIHSITYTNRLMNQYRNRLIEVVGYLEYIQ